MKIKISTIFIFTTMIAILLSSCSGLIGTGNSSNEIKASGTISAPAVKVASEIGGKVTELNIAEGDKVQAGDVLFTTDDKDIQAQYVQAEDAVQVAKTTVEAAKAQLTSAQIQFELALQGARLQDQTTRSQELQEQPPSEIDLPSWYYEKNEKIDAREAEVTSARENLESKIANLEKELADASNDDFVDTERRLAEAQTRFENARLTLQQAEGSTDSEELKDVAEKERDAALADLEAVQREYDRMLTTDAADRVLEARAKVMIARLRLDNALDARIQLQSGEESLQVKAAQAGVEQAQTVVNQAEATLTQAESALTVLKLQLDKSRVKAPVSGVITALNLEKGELAGPGTVVLTITQLDPVTLTVYIPETQYGLIQLGQQVKVTTDSFPGESITGKVQYIADQAEYTPRNVATIDGRKTTVYAVKILIPNPDLHLKPGMPADAEFSQNQDLARINN